MDVLEGIGGHFHEHHDVILAWPWKLFCAKWARFMEQAWAENKRQNTRRRARAAQQTETERERETRALRERLEQ